MFPTQLKETANNSEGDALYSLECFVSTNFVTKRTVIEGKYDLSWMQDSHLQHKCIWYDDEYISFSQNSMMCELKMDIILFLCGTHTLELSLSSILLHSMS
jgi:hypothetical protein